ncbi:MAG: ABC transporter substrate-binding protein, partial [Chloroflexota bacterium]|nr:ABC transporter substrate-binding protein [Chloroflexota bacterium]
GATLGAIAGRSRHVGAYIQEQPAGLPVMGGTPTVAMAAMPFSLDAVQTDQLATWWLADQLYDTPLRETPNGGIAAGLARAVRPADDGLAYTLSLRPGVRFHDNEPLRARDVAATCERVRDPSTGGINAWRLEQVAAVEAPDDETVVLRLARPNVALPAILTSLALAVLPERATTASNPFSAGQPPPGTGPFAFVAREAGGDLLLRRNPAYWRSGLPYLDGLRLQFLTEDTARSTAMVTGTVDLIQSAPLLDVPMLAEGTNVALVGGLSRQVCGLALNLRQGPLVDIRLRRLVARAIDREALVAAATAGQAVPQATLFPEEHWAHLAVPIAPPDTAGVLAELAALGYPAGLRLSLICPDQDPSLANAAVLLQEQLARAGIAAALELLEERRIADAVAAGSFDVVIGYRGPWLDPHELVRPLMASDGVANLSGYANPAIDALITAAVATEDVDARTEHYRAIEELMLIDAPWITLFLPNHFHAVTTRLANLHAYPSGSLHGLRRSWMQPAAPDDSDAA